VIKFGVMSNSHPASAADLSRLVDEMVVEAQQAETYGFDSFFVTEHHQEPSGYLPSPLPLLAALAARTSTIRLGTGIAVLPLYHPVRMAEDCAVIDIISNVRLILGVGMGYQDVDFAAYGLRVSERVSLFEEGVEIIKRAWTEEKLSFVGKRYTLTNISVTPKPVQKPRPPIWVAAVGDEAMKRAGRVGDALLADSFQLPARLKPRVDLYRQTAASRGNRAQVVLFREGFVARTRDEAVREYEAALLSTHRYYWRHGSYYPDIKKEEDLDLKRIGLDRLILGSPKDCAERVRAWNAEIGADYFLIRFKHPAGPPHAKVMEALKLFGEQVIPEFR
jgi:alkanesulfonate monooxygenase SsuD/methylene tetrahydromethanopterin reductase-like flavin-dependent oxidoreductase (luciferase family)